MGETRVHGVSESSATSPRLSLLVVTFNRPDELLDLLESVARQESACDVLAEILVLDNGTTADYSSTWSFIRSHEELKIKVLRSDENIGAAAGKNMLLTLARGDVLLVVDDDVVFSQTRDLASLATVFEDEAFRRDNVGLVQPRIVHHETRELQRSAFPHKRRRPDADAAPFLTSFFAGAAHVIKKEAIQRAGLYPDDFFIYMEEYDLGYRIIESGYAIGYDPRVTVGHKEAIHGRLADHQKLRRQWVNKTRVAWRYLPWRFFLTTGVLWSFEYLRRVRGHPEDYFRGWLDILRIPFTEKRSPLGQASLAYLKRVDARLWY